MKPILAFLALSLVLLASASSGIAIDKPSPIDPQLIPIHIPQQWRMYVGDTAQPDNAPALFITLEKAYLNPCDGAKVCTDVVRPRSNAVLGLTYDICGSRNDTIHPCMAPILYKQVTLHPGEKTYFAGTAIKLWTVYPRGAKLGIWWQKDEGKK